VQEKRRRAPKRLRPMEKGFIKRSFGVQTKIKNILKLAENALTL
jgi:hypothetical protein